MKNHRLWRPIAAAIVAGPMVILFAGPGSPQGNHGEGHDALHHWYETLHDRNGRACCNRQDCRPTQSRVKGGNVEVMVDGIWAVVPTEKILPVPSPDLGSHVCSMKRPNGYPLGHVFCVVLGSGV